MQYKKIIWQQNQVLNAGYLQQQDKYFETLIFHQNRSAYNWGFLVLELELGEEMSLSLIKARGIFPDGTLFDISEPLSLTVHEISALTNVYLALPVSNGQEIDFDSKSNHAFRYQVTDALCQDMTQPSNNNSTFELKMAMPNLQLLLETQLNEQWMTLPVARIKLENAQIVFDQTFWMPCLNSFSESTLTGRQLKQILANVLNQLAQFKSHLQANTTDNLSGVFTTNHFLQHLVNKYQALLKHLSTLPQVHPEQFFRYLLSVVTELMVEDIDVFYDHDDMFKAFTELSQQLVNFIEQRTIQRDCLILRLSSKPYPDVAQFRSAEKFAMTPNDRLILEIDQDLKVLMVAPDRLIQSWYNSLSEGIQQRQLDQLPNNVRKRQGYLYYELLETNEMETDYLSVYVKDVPLGENHELTLWFT
jgi:type VI secretion system protein ImpJ